MSAAPERTPVYGRDLPEQPIGTVLTLDCPTCGGQFRWESEEGRQGPMTYCSRSCRNRGRRENARATRIALHELDPAVLAGGQLRLLLCLRCESMFGWLPLREDNTEPPLTCSPTCRDALRLRRRKARQAEKDVLKAQRRAEHEANEARAQERKAEKAARAGRVAEAAEIRAELDRRRRIAAGWITPPAPVVDEHAEHVAALAAAARELLLPAMYCACGKVASPTKEAAKEAKRAVELRTGRVNEVRYYACEHGSWHWTRMDADLDGWRARQSAQ